MVVEQPEGTRPGVMTGRCDHYTLISVATQRARGAMIEVDVVNVDADRTEAVEAPCDTIRRLPVLSPVPNAVS